MVIMPKAAYVTWQGNRYEGHGVTPDMDAPWLPEEFIAGRDSQLQAGIEVLAAR
jgi:C-terminal processing protease CtpA/Prc